MFKSHTSSVALMWQNPSRCFWRDDNNSLRWDGGAPSSQAIDSSVLSLFFSNSPKACSWNMRSYNLFIINLDDTWCHIILEPRIHNNAKFDCNWFDIELLHFKTDFKFTKICFPTLVIVPIKVSRLTSHCAALNEHIVQVLSVLTRIKLA